MSLNKYTFVERCTLNGGTLEQNYYAETREEALTDWHEDLSHWNGLFVAVTEA